MLSGASERLPGHSAGPEPPQPCTGAQRAAVREWEEPSGRRPRAVGEGSSAAARAARLTTLGCMSEWGGAPSASSMAVMPSDQTSALVSRRATRRSEDGVSREYVGK